MTWRPLRQLTKAEASNLTVERSSYLLDENMPKVFAEEIAEEGLRARTVPMERMAGLDDGAVLAHARRNDWILLTLDKDFRAFDVQQSPGVFVLQSGKELGHALRHVVGFTRNCRQAWRHAVVRVSSPNDWRVRSWYREGGVVDDVRIRGFCEGRVLEALPRRGLKHADEMMTRLGYSFE